MNRKLLYLSIAVIVLILSASSVSAIVSPPPGIKDPTLSKIWNSIIDLQTQITALNTKVNNIPAGVHFGAWTDQDPYNPIFTYRLNTEYVAATDGFVIVSAGTLGTVTEDFLLSGNTPAQGALPQYKLFAEIHPGDSGGFTLPVRAGDTWVIKGSPTMSSPDLIYHIYWLPLTS